MSRQGGYTYFIVLMMLALTGFGLAAVSTYYSHASQREREQDLLFAGEQFRSAIKSYNKANPKVGDGYPKSLQELLRDPNAPNVRRHLRRLYVDPVLGSTDWGVVRLKSGGIVGVYSKSALPPIIRNGFEPGAEDFADATRISDWRFLAAAMPTQALEPPPDGSPVAAAKPPPPPPPAEDVATAAPPWNEPSPCEALRIADQEDCSTIAARYGRDQEIRCLDAAARRQQACSRNGPGNVPPLPNPVAALPNPEATPGNR